MYQSKGRTSSTEGTDRGQVVVEEGLSMTSPMPVAPFARLLSVLTSVTLLLPACAGESRVQQRAQAIARTRPAHVRVVAKHAAGKARPEGCRVEFTAQEPTPAQRLRKLADLELTGYGLDRARAESLLAAKACPLGAETLAILREDYGSEEQSGRIEATAYAFHTPVQILPSGLDVEVPARPLDCRVVFFRTQQPEAPYDEIAGLHLNVPAGAFGAPTPGSSQEQALSELRQAACHLGADAIIMSNEQYDVPMLGTRVSGTAILFRESRKNLPKQPGAQEL